MEVPGRGMGGDGHDHGRCVDAALGRAERLCQARSVRLTHLRRRVLELVWQSHRPIGAYDILERLAAERGPVGPPTVYRALDFLAEQGLVHRLDSLNAFIGCSAPAEGHRAYFLICRGCRTVIELDDAQVALALSGAAARAGFSIESETVELAGACARCRAAAS